MIALELYERHGLLSSKHDVPDAAKPLSSILDKPELTFYDLFPQRFFSMDYVEELNRAGGGHMVLTPSGVSMEWVYDPEKDESGANGEWKPCMNFKETDTQLVLNKSRARLCVQLTGSSVPAHWSKVGKITLFPGVLNKKAQLTFQQAGGVDGEAVNGNGVRPNAGSVDDDLFGKKDDEIPF